MTVRVFVFRAGAGFVGALLAAVVLLVVGKTIEDAAVARNRRLAQAKLMQKAVQR